jgi:hypothetical protein
LATTLILEKNQYPKLVEHDIFCDDTEHTYRLIKSGLIEKGFVKVLHSKKFGDTTSFISFTTAAKPYLLATPAADKNKQNSTGKSSRGNLCCSCSNQDDEFR